MTAESVFFTPTAAVQIETIIDLALTEDIGDGDITTLATVPVGRIYRGCMRAKATGVVAGLEIARQVFQRVDPTVDFARRIDEGSTIQPGDVLAIVTGPGQALLSAERVALNFLQRMSGIATLTRRYVDAVAGTGAVILDTRKTAPGQRLTDKLAVALGGGGNHRIGLFDMVLLKENHLAAAGGIAAAVTQVRAHDARQRPIEVEVRTLDELREALALEVDRIMLDNMSLAEMRRAVALASRQVELEASGNVALNTVADIAATGVDYISVGALTHSVTALDISFLLEDVTEV